MYLSAIAKCIYPNRLIAKCIFPSDTRQVSHLGQILNLNCPNSVAEKETKMLARQLFEFSFHYLIVETNKYICDRSYRR